MEIAILSDIAVIFLLAIGVSYIFHKVQIPAVVGFMLTGILIGPYGFQWITSLHEVEVFAELGVVLLLFTIGMEFSLNQLMENKTAVLLGGFLQVLLTILVTMGISVGFGMDWGTSVFIGFLVALSSTAIILKILQEKAEVKTPHGVNILGILIFQDIIVVPMLLFTPLLSGSAEASGSAALMLLGKALGIIVIVYFLGRYIVPMFLYQVARTANRELFLLAIIATCLAIAYLTSKAGLSLAFGAFLAGLIISESEYSHQALSNMLPFRNIFMTFFFISIGMMFDFTSLLSMNGVWLFLATVALIVMKAIIATGVIVLLGYPLRIGMLVGLALAQVGEFSFILSRVGLKYELLSQNDYQKFLAVAILSMTATPFLLKYSPAIAQATLKLVGAKKRQESIMTNSSMAPVDIEDHLLIIGFGVAGRNVASAAKVTGIRYMVLEVNPDTVKSASAQGEPIYYGDATNELILKHAKADQAAVMVILINDPVATRKITMELRALNPHGYIIARTRYVREVKPLYEIGANEVIPEEFETSIEIFARVLNKFLIPKEDIDRIISNIRSDGYQMFRSLLQPSPQLSDMKLSLPNIEISAYRIKENSPLLKKKISESGLRENFGISVLAIRKGEEVIANPDPQVMIEANDILYVMGAPDETAAAAGMV